MPPAWHDDTRDHRPARVYQILAWVGIIAGVLFIVAMVFFSGVFLGRVSGGYHGWHRGYQSGQMGPEVSMNDCPMMRPGGMMGPGGMMWPGGMGPGGMMGPGGSGSGGMGPGGPGPGGMGPGGMMGPSQPSPSTTPSSIQRPS